MDTREFALLNPDGTVKEWPVYGYHIEARRLPESRFTIVRQVPAPVFDQLTETVQRLPPVLDENDALVAEWVVNPRPMDEIIQSMIDILADLRWQREVGGITLPDQTPVRTDDKTQNRLTAAAVQFANGNITQIRWKLGSGFITLSAAQFDAISDAVTLHVASCFEAEGAVVDQIAAATDIEALKAIELNGAFETAYAAAIQAATSS